MSLSQTPRLILGLALILSPAIILAQDPTIPTQAQTSPSASASSSRSNQQDSSTTTAGLTAQQMQDKKFLRDLAQGGLAEIKLGELASIHAAGDDVKTFGAKMVTDHTQIPKDLSKPDQAVYDKLSKLSGDDFDKQYLTVMLEDHRKDLRALRQESVATQDTTLHAAIDKTFPIVREHMGMTVKLAREKGIAVPAPPQRAGATPPSQ